MDDPQGFIVPTTFRNRLLEETIAGEVEGLLPKNYFGFQIVECPRMPDTEILAFSDYVQAKYFIEAVKIIGYDKAKELCGISDNPDG